MAGRPPRYNVSVRTASSDSQYWGRYWNGDRPILYSALRSTAGQTNALTTGIRLGTSLSATYGLSNSLTTSASGADSYGITTYATQSLITGINGGVSVDDNTSGTDTITWTSDGTGNFARVAYNSAGTIRLIWSLVNRAKQGLYVRFDWRSSDISKTSKLMKLFGQGYPTTYSNCTWPYNVDGHREILYDDSVSGGDLGSETLFSGSLTGGGAYSRTPHPTFNNTSSTVYVANTWYTDENWAYFNDDGVNNGEFAHWPSLVNTPDFYMSNVYNSGTGLKLRDYVTFGDFSSSGGWTLDIRNLYISYDRPTGRGI